MAALQQRLIEHLNHAGRENGNLFATYDQMVAFGISRRLVAKTIDEAEQLNLIEVHRFARENFTKAYPLRFRLTFLPDKVVNEANVYYGEATHEWRRVTEEQARKITGRKKRISMFRSGTQPVPQTTQIGARSGTLDGSKIAENCDSSRVPEVERLFRSPCTGPGGHQSEMEKFK